MNEWTNHYKYAVYINGYEDERLNSKADAIASARQIWRRKDPVSLYLRGEMDENGKEIRRELPFHDVEVTWIGDADSHAVWYRSIDPQERKVG